MENEKSSLIRQCFPKLRAYCRKRYDLDFRVVDLKFGTQFEPIHERDAKIYPSTDVMLKEIEKCVYENEVGPLVLVRKHRRTCIPLHDCIV